MHGLPMQVYEAWSIIALGYFIPLVFLLSLWTILTGKEDSIIFHTMVKMLASEQPQNLRLLDLASTIETEGDIKIAYWRKSLRTWKVFAVIFILYGLFILCLILAINHNIVHLQMSRDASAIPWKPFGIGLLAWTFICILTSRWLLRTSFDRILKNL